MMDLPLKYGCNPHQGRARVQGEGISLLHGEPGYINLLDAVFAWQLVRELKAATGRPSAACFKHVSPSGAALAKPLTARLRAAWFLPDEELSPVATAYARARGGDRLSAFGDAAAVSEPVDRSLALLLSREVSDLLIAPAFEPDALELLKRKKQGRYLILQADPDHEPPRIEERQVFGLKLTQERNTSVVNRELFAGHDLSDDLLDSLVLATLALKYTQSNSVILACDGQLTGVGAGQQSRVHCTRLACDKADKWMLQQHPQVLGLPFRKELSRIQRTNLVDQYLLLDSLADAERAALLAGLEREPAPLAPAERLAFFREFDGLVLSSDAFFPFRDSIDRAALSNVQALAHPGGSVRDEEVRAVAAAYGIPLVTTGLRCFTH